MRLLLLSSTSTTTSPASSRLRLDDVPLWNKLRMQLEALVRGVASLVAVVAHRCPLRLATAAATRSPRSIECTSSILSGLQTFHDWARLLSGSGNRLGESWLVDPPVHCLIQRRYSSKETEGNLWFPLIPPLEAKTSVRPKIFKT